VKAADSDNTYYWNPASDETTWERPVEPALAGTSRA
jgi:hypothetical protein